jgi:hypothetical protein
VFWRGFAAWHHQQQYKAVQCVIIPNLSYRMLLVSDQQRPKKECPEMVQWHPFECT